MRKYTNIPSKIRNNFNEKRQEIVMNDFLHLLVSLKIDQRYLGGVKRANCQLTYLQVFQILILKPFFAVSDLSHYTTSVMRRMFGGSMDEEIMLDLIIRDNSRLAVLRHRLNRLNS